MTEPVLSGDDRKRLKEEFKNRPRVAGVFTITNTTEGRVFLGSCLDAERVLRRIRFELQLGSFKNRALQADFARLGEEAFVFAVVDTVPEEAKDVSEELELLEMEHLAGLNGSTAYNTVDGIRFR